MAAALPAPVAFSDIRVPTESSILTGVLPYVNAVSVINTSPSINGVVSLSVPDLTYFTKIVGSVIPVVGLTSNYLSTTTTTSESCPLRRFPTNSLP